MTFLFEQFAICDRKGITYRAVTSWVSMCTWERNHLTAYYRISPAVEQYFSVFRDEDPPYTIEKWLDLDPNVQEAAVEYDQHRDELKPLKIDRKEWMAMEPDVRTMRLDFARKIKSKGHV